MCKVVSMFASQLVATLPQFFRIRATDEINPAYPNTSGIHHERSLATRRVFGCTGTDAGIDDPTDGHIPT